MGKQALWLIASYALLAGCAQAGAAATAPAPPAHPRVCLVLSGGGARGLAHVGVLKVLEELRVPIDCIAGTSMGAIVGGLYAGGMTAEQLAAMVRSVDWQEDFRDRPSRRELAFRRKQDDRNYLVRLPIGLKHGEFLLPKGFIQGQKLQETLRRATLAYDDVPSFDELPTPFRAVATDLATGKPVILGKGDLAEAMHASMAAPGVFAPVDEQGQLLVDGGLTDNLPIDVGRAMGADVLIVVDVTYPLQPRRQLDSALSISNQMLAILMRRDADRQKATLGPRDVLIEPDLGGMASTDFSVVERTVAIGEQAALALRARLAALAEGEAAYRQYAQRRAQYRTATPVIDFVSVDDASKPYERTILATMRSLVGRPLDAQKIAGRVTELYGLGLFETVDYTVITRPTDAGPQTGIEVRARRKSWGPNYVRFGLNLQDDFQGNSMYNAAARFLVTEINGLGAEWLTDVQIGSDPKVVSEFYQPLTARRLWFVAPSARVEVRTLRVYANNVEIADFREREAEADLDVGRELSNWGEIRAGLRRVNGFTRVRLGDPLLVNPQFNKGELVVKFSYDRLDNVDFPREGQVYSLQWNGDRTDLGADVASDQVSANWLMARSRGRNTLLLWTSAGATLDGRIKPTSLQDFYTLGGFLNLSGLAAQSLTGPNYAIARAVYFRNIGHGGAGLLEFPAYLGASVEAGDVSQRRGTINFASVRKDFSLFLGLDTFLGPLYLGGGYDQSGNSAYFLFLGRTF